MTRDEQWLLEEKYDGKKTPEYEADKERLAKGEPLGYVIGFQPFLGLKIFLDSKPLIPRPETEWWIEQLLESRTSDVRLSFLDLCAGSGAIGCAALARLPESRVYFGEIDPAHEATIEKNIRENNLDASRAVIGIGDLFAPFENVLFDIIAANPPYIPEHRGLPKDVADHEPSLALLSGEDGLDVIRRIANSVRCHLTESGVAWIECDSTHAEAAQKLFEQQEFRAEIRTDQYDRPRCVVVSFQ